MPSAIPINLPVSPQTCTWFASSGMLVSYNTSALYLISFNCDTLEVATEKTIRFAAEDIADAKSFDDNLFILSRTQSGSQWARRWQRRSDMCDDGWTSENPLYTYTLRLYSLASASQFGPSLPVPQPAVHAKILARGHKVIITTVGPHCVASVWRAPVAGNDNWQILHEELTWDPREIAKERGYEDPEEEPAFMDEEEAYNGVDDDEPPRADRYEYHDREILDYTFLSDRFVLRLSERALDRGEASFFLDVFELNSVISPHADRDSLRFGLDLQSILRVEVDNNMAYQQMTTAFVCRDNTSVDQSDIISVMIYSSDTPSQSFIRVSKLLSFVSNPSPTLLSMYEMRKAIISASATGPTPFTRHAKSFGRLELSPTMSKHLVLFPTCDVDPGSEHPTLAILRFLDFSEDDGPPKQIDVPLSFLLTGAAGAPPDLDRTTDAFGDWPRFEVGWDGGNVLVVTYVNVDAQWPADSKLWLVKMDVSILQKLGLS